MNKIVRTNDDSKSYAGWTCGWCPPQKDGSAAKPFWGINATKALSHVVKVSGNDVCLCCGIILAAKAGQYNALYLLKAMQKDLRHNKREMMIAGIKTCKIILYIHWRHPCRPQNDEHRCESFQIFVLSSVL